MASLFLPLLLTCLLSLTPLVSGWGAQGHIATAQLAQLRFHPVTSQLSSSLLPDVGGDISRISSWADEVRNANNNPYYPWSAPYHYVNTAAYQCTYIPALNCANDACVDGAVRNYTQRSFDSSLSSTQRMEALMFLVHFIGDLHQPLHAGFSSDSGGNLVRVRFNGGNTSNLHSLWDSGMIDYRVRTEFNRNYGQWTAHLNQLIDTTYAKEVPQWLTCNSSAISHSSSAPTSLLEQYVPCSEQWVQESSTQCCATVYLDDQMEPMNTSRVYNLSVSLYYDRNIDLIEKRIAMAGVRMAYVLNTISAALYPQDVSSSTGADPQDASSSSSGAEPQEVSSSSTATYPVEVSSSSSITAAYPTAAYPTGPDTAPVGNYTSSSSSTGAESGGDDDSGSMVAVVAAVLFVLLLVAALVMGFLYWRKRKYGLQGWCDSADPQTSRARLLEEEDTTAGYSRVV